jgi:hypothetical protein
VTRCRNLLDSLNGHLMSFDFRNGPLRRKVMEIGTFMMYFVLAVMMAAWQFDGVKYGVKKLEDLIYELSVVGLQSR